MEWLPTVTSLKPDHWVRVVPLSVCRVFELDPLTAAVKGLRNNPGMFKLGNPAMKASPNITACHELEDQALDEVGDIDMYDVFVDYCNQSDAARFEVTP